MSENVHFETLVLGCIYILKCECETRQFLSQFLLVKNFITTPAAWKYDENRTLSWLLSPKSPTHVCSMNLPYFPLISTPPTHRNQQIFNVCIWYQNVSLRHILGPTTSKLSRQLYLEEFSLPYPSFPCRSLYCFP